LTGKCVDIGKLKGPILRGLAARTLFSQWLGCGTEQRRGVWLLHEFDWHHGEGVL